MLDNHVQLDAYRRAQLAIAELKAAVLDLIASSGERGLKNSEVGRALGVYQGHVGHEGHVSRTILRMLEDDEVVEQVEKGGRWRLRQYAEQG